MSIKALTLSALAACSPGTHAAHSAGMHTLNDHNSCNRVELPAPKTPAPLSLLEKTLQVQGRPLPGEENFLPKVFTGNSTQVASRDDGEIVVAEVGRNRTHYRKYETQKKVVQCPVDLDEVKRSVALDYAEVHRILNQLGIKTRYTTFPVYLKKRPHSQHWEVDTLRHKFDKVNGRFAAMATSSMTATTIQVVPQVFANLVRQVGGFATNVIRIDARGVMLSSLFWGLDGYKMLTNDGAIPDVASLQMNWIINPDEQTCVRR